MVSAMVFHFLFSVYYHVTGCCTCSPGFAPACRPMTADQARVWPYFGQVVVQVRQTHTVGWFANKKRSWSWTLGKMHFFQQIWGYDGIWYVAFEIYLVKSWTTCYYSLVMFMSMAVSTAWWLLYLSKGGHCWLGIWSISWVLKDVRDLCGENAVQKLTLSRVALFQLCPVIVLSPSARDHRYTPRPGSEVLDLQNSCQHQMSQKGCSLTGFNQKHTPRPFDSLYKFVGSTVGIELAPILKKRRLAIRLTEGIGWLLLPRTAGARGCGLSLLASGARWNLVILSISLGLADLEGLSVDPLFFNLDSLLTADPPTVVRFVYRLVCFTPIWKG